MIRAGITGGDTRAAGELIRILMNHPDVDIMAVTSPSMKGKPLHSHHHGLVGEQEIAFSDSLPLDLLSVLFLTDKSYVPDTLPAGLKIVDLAGVLEGKDDFFSEKVEFGLSEINRKPLVRGARIAYVPNALASLALVMLGPLAQHLLLNADLQIDALIPGDLISPDFISQAQSQIKTRLKSIQNSFEGDVRIIPHESESARGMRLRISLPISLKREDVEGIYEGIYDDHNFTFLTPAPMEFDEIEGTNKCLINVSKSEKGEILLDAVADPRMRGGAGEAVHLMNLLFGLHEKTGLALKTLKF